MNSLLISSVVQESYIQNLGEQIKIQFQKKKKKLFQQELIIPINQFNISLKIQEVENFNITNSQFFVDISNEKSQCFVFCNNFPKVQLEVEKIMISNSEFTRLFGIKHEQNFIEVVKVHEILINFPKVNFEYQVKSQINLNQYIQKENNQNLQPSTKKYKNKENLKENNNQQSDQIEPQTLAQIIDFLSTSTEDEDTDLIQSLKSQGGSKNIQKQLETYSDIQIFDFIKKILPETCNLMLDQYANYIFSTLCKRAKQKQRVQILKKIQPNFIKIACDKKGTHAMQQLICSCDSQEEYSYFIEILKNKKVLFQIACNNQGSHVIKKIFNFLPLQQIQILAYIFIENFQQIVYDQFGICVFKELMVVFQQNQEIRQQIIQQIEQNLNRLFQDQYGNYVLQQALKFYTVNCDYIIQQIQINFNYLANQKISSNIVELAVQNSNFNQMQVFVDLFVQNIVELMIGKFSNFVLNNSLKFLYPEDRIVIIYIKPIIISMKQNISLIKNNTYYQRWSSFCNKEKV